MGRVSGAFYLAGSTTVALVSSSGWSRLEAPLQAVVVVLATTGVVAGAALARWGGRLPRWTYHGVVALAALLVAVGVQLTSDETAAVAVAGMFVFCTVDNLYFFTRLGALVHTAALLCLVAGSLLLRGVPWGVTAGIVLVQALVIAAVSTLAQRASDSTRDHLTGLPNRRAFDEQLEEAVRTAHRAGTPLSVVVADIDRFKEVNDSRGHAAGDALLHELSATLVASLRSVAASGGGTRGLLARLGGDEFAVVLPGVDAEGVRRAAERLLRDASPVSLSLGAALREDGEDASSLVRRATTALQEAKSAGRGRVRTARPDEGPLVRALAGAVAADALDVHLQPVVDAGTGAMVGVEALARWHHPVFGDVSPAVFVPLAEAHGLVVDMGAVLARRAVRAAAALAATRQEPLLLTVNASGKQLVHRGYVESVLELLLAEGWPAGQLVVEVTESTVEACSSQAREALVQLRAAGVRVAIDDFGTGYSTLSQLDALPADFLKLDARFSAELVTSERRRAVLRGLLRLCEDLDLVVIAEGVETSEQAELVARAGGPLAQGYHFQRPAPGAELVAYAPGAPVPVV